MNCLKKSELPVCKNIKMKNFRLSFSFLLKKVMPILILLSVLQPLSQVMAEEQSEERIYYILVDRYINGSSENDLDVDIDDPDSYYGGDLPGITDRISSLKEMGFTTINLSPIMTSSAFHGFHTTDFQNIDPQFGNISDLQNLVTAAHEEDMKVILDFVLTHTSPEHSWVSDHTDWISGQISNQWGTELPALNLENQELQEYFFETAILWLTNAKIDGFHFYVDENTPSTFIQKLRNRIKAENESAIVIMDGKETDFQMNHHFQERAVELLKKPSNSIEPLFELIDGQDTLYMESAETPRFAFEAVGEGYHPVTRWKLASTLLYTLPGSSLFYQGVEVPMNNGAEEPDLRMAELNREDEEITSHLEKLATIYEDSSALQNGDLDFVKQEGAMSIYKRSNDEETMYIAINNDTETHMASIAEIEGRYQLRGLLEDDIVRQQEDGMHKIILERETSNIFILEEDGGLNWIFITAVVLVLGGFIVFVVLVGRKNKQMKKSNA